MLVNVSVCCSCEEKTVKLGCSDAEFSVRIAQSILYNQSIIQLLVAQLLQDYYMLVRLYVRCSYEKQSK